MCACFIKFFQINYMEKMNENVRNTITPSNFTSANSKLTR